MFYEVANESSETASGPPPQHLLHAPGSIHSDAVFMPGLCLQSHHAGVRILVVEDENQIAEWLRREAFAVDVAYDRDAALERFGINEYDESARQVVDGKIPLDRRCGRRVRAVACWSPASLASHTGKGPTWR